MLFKEIIGQQGVKHRLINSVKENRVSHAQLFLGPEGSGNLALAVAYAQYVCCQNKSLTSLSKGGGDQKIKVLSSGEDLGEASDSCGTCSSCVKFNKLVHPDLHFVYPQIVKKDKDEEGTRVNFLNQWREAFLENPYLNLNQWYEQIGIENKQGIISAEDTAEMIRKLSLKTFESEFKTVIIWMPERINATAANKMLKILEEPPQKTLFILVAENQDQLLPTVLSRTQLIKINKLPDEELLNVLIEKHKLQYHQAKNIAHLVDGNYNEAMTLIKQEDQEFSNSEMFKKWMRLCYESINKKEKIGDLISWSEAMASAKDVGREKQKNFLSYAMHMVRESLLVSYGDQEMVRLDGAELEFSQKFSPFIHQNNCEQFVNELNDAYFHIERNANPKILFLDLSFRISKLLRIPE